MKIFGSGEKIHYLCTRFIVLWCNGSTTVFGSVSGGSNPPGTTDYEITLQVFADLEGYFFYDLSKIEIVEPYFSENSYFYLLFRGIIGVKNRL